MFGKMTDKSVLSIVNQRAEEYQEAFGIGAANAFWQVLSFFGAQPNENWTGYLVEAAGTTYIQFTIPFPLEIGGRSFVLTDLEVGVDGADANNKIVGVLTDKWTNHTNKTNLDTYATAITTVSLTTIFTAQAFNMSGVERVNVQLTATCSNGTTLKISFVRCKGYYV